MGVFTEPVTLLWLKSVAYIHSYMVAIRSMYVCLKTATYHTLESDFSTGYKFTNIILLTYTVDRLGE